jgi:redox-sensitive bicupin YhaK (pirin superfamily)
MNGSFDEPVDLLQIWITPKQKGIPPSYEQQNFRLTKNAWTLLADGTLDRRNGEAVYLHQHAKIVRGTFDRGKEIVYKPAKGRGTYLFLISGGAKANDQTLGKRDALATEGDVTIITTETSDILLLEVPLKV